MIIQGEKLSADERLSRKRAANRKYYRANQGRYRAGYKRNTTNILAAQKLYRDLNKDAIALRDKLYNDTKRNKT